MFLGYTVKQLLSICAICNVISPIKYVLYFYISTYWSVCVCVCVCVCAVSNMAVFCSSLISCSPDMLLRFCLSDFEMVAVAPITTGISSLLLLLLLLT